MQSVQRNYSFHQSGKRLPAHPAKRRFPVKIVVLSLCLLLIIVITKQVFASGDHPNQVKGASISQDDSKEEKKLPEPPKRVVDTSMLSETLSKGIKKYPYNTSVSVVDLNSGKLYQSGDTYPFLAASTTKLLTAMLYLNNVQAGQTSLSNIIGDKPAEQQLQAMINKSDNDAWQTMNDHLSRESLGIYAKKQGLNSYDPVKNTVTSNDIAVLLAKLYNRELLNDQYTKLLLSWMQNTSEERFIPAGVPPGSVLFHKSGYLNDRVHDVAIVDNGNAPFIIVIYSKTYGNTPYDFQTGQKLYSEIVNSVATIFK